jgi:hypothetical protein
MNIPRFTAEASLHKTSGHYQTGSPAVYLRKQANSAIYPAMMKEDIEVHGCAPGSILWEDGGDWGCNPIDFGGLDGGGGGGPVVVADGGGLHGPGGGVGSPSDSKPIILPDGLQVCNSRDFDRAKKLYPDAVKKCLNNTFKTLDQEFPSALCCGPGGAVSCCVGDSEVLICDDIYRPPDKKKK